jgi:hypothetical protein
MLVAENPCGWSHERGRRHACTACADRDHSDYHTRCRTLSAATVTRQEASDETTVTDATARGDRSQAAGLVGMCMRESCLQWLDARAAGRHAAVAQTAASQTRLRSTRFSERPGRLASAKPLGLMPSRNSGIAWASASQTGKRPGVQWRTGPVFPKVPASSGETLRNPEACVNLSARRASLPSVPRCWRCGGTLVAVDLPLDWPGCKTGFIDISVATLPVLGGFAPCKTQIALKPDVIS